MTKFKKFAIGFTAAIAGITICMGVSYIQAKLSPVVGVDTRELRLLTAEESTRVEKLIDEQTEIVHYAMHIEMAEEEINKLAKKKNPSDLDISLLNWYNSVIEDSEKKLSEMPTYDELTSQIDDILYY